MHHVGFAPLAAAVSNAGGLGIITALTQPTPADLRKEIQKCRKLTDKPFGVNFTMIASLKNFDFEGFAQVRMWTSVETSPPPLSQPVPASLQGPGVRSPVPTSGQTPVLGHLCSTMRIHAQMHPH